MTNRVLIVAGWLGTLLTALAIGRFAAIDSRWDTYLIWAAAAGIACAVIAAIASSRSRVRPSPVAADEQTRRSMATITAAVAIALALTILAGHYRLRWDLTANHSYQLAPETRAALRALDAPVRVVVFAEPADLLAYRDLLKEYSEASSVVSVDYVDPDAEPALVRQYNIDAYGTVVIDHKEGVERIKGISEQAYTNAIARLREGRTRKVYFTTGHAERDIASTERVGYSSVAGALQQENFGIGVLNFTEQADVPGDATVVIVAGPRADFFSAEIEALRRYSEAGGAMLFLIDPYQDLKRYITESGMALFMIDPASASVTGELRNLTAFVRDQGAELANDVIVDTGQMGQFLDTDASVPVVASYPRHPITEGQTSLTAYPMARSVRPLSSPGRTVSPIIETSDRTWSETDIQQLSAGAPSLDPEKGDRPGPVSLGVAISVPPGPPRVNGPAPRERRLVVVGDSDFVANYSANVPGNSAMLLAMVRWLAQEKVTVIPARALQERLLTMSTSQHSAVSWFAVLVLPGFALATAVYLRRPRSPIG